MTPVKNKFTAEAYRALPQYDPETIERCAQVAEEFGHYGDVARAIAAAIRKLKDEM